MKISVVEDLPEIRKSLVQNINRTDGMTCISVYESAEEALDKLLLDLPDLVLMDIGLPKMNGVECMIRLGLKGATMNFLMFTVFDSDEYVFEALQAGASGYILKSEGAIGTIKAIKEYEAGGAPMSREIARKVMNSFKKNRCNTSETFDMLTKQQYIILQQLAEGLQNKEIADRLGISERTVKQHNHSIYKRLQVFNRVEAVKKYLNKKE